MIFLPSVSTICILLIGSIVLFESIYVSFPVRPLKVDPSSDGIIILSPSLKFNVVEEDVASLNKLGDSWELKLSSSFAFEDDVPQDDKGSLNANEDPGPLRSL